jgi:hypothetical protein
MRYLLVFVLVIMAEADAFGQVERAKAAGEADSQYEVIPVPKGAFRPGEKFLIEREGNSYRIGPALKSASPATTQVIMPAAAADALVTSQSKLINELLEKVRELEARVDRLERKGK